MKRLLKNVLVAGALALGAACSSFEVKPGFNAVYSGVNTQAEKGYTRVFTGGSVGNDAVRMHHHSLNEISGTDINTYFGRNSLGVEAANLGIEVIVEAKGGSSGLFAGQPQYGIRDNNLPGMLGADWGFVQGTTNGEDINLTLLYGKSLDGLSSSSSPLSLELFNSYDHKKDTKDSNLTEIIVDWSLTNNFSLFARQDTNDLKFNDSSYIIGGVLKF